MKVSAQAAEQASTNSHGKLDSPALAQLKAAIEPDALTGGDGDQAASDTATAVLETGEDEDGDEDEEFVGIGQPGLKPGEIATETMDATQEGKKPADPTPEPALNAAAQQTPSVTATNGVVSSIQKTTGVTEGPAPTISNPVPAAPAPYDPIAEVDEEIAENNERIVAHAIRASELDTMLKATKKSLKTAADEGVELAVRRAGLLLQQKEKAERDAAGRGNATGVSQLREGNPDAGSASAKDHPIPIANGSYSVPDDAGSIPAPASLSDPESTEDFHARIAEQFAPDPAADLPPTPEQERYDHEFRSLAIEGLEGLTPKIVEILHANQIFTVGAFQDWPKKTGCADYTQMSGGNAKLTETRYTKIMDAMMAYMKANPRPEGEPQPAPAPVAVESVPNTVTTAVVGGLDVDDI